MLTTFKILFPGLLATLFAFSIVNCPAQQLIKPTVTNESWNRPFEPFRIAGNLYYVGTEELASYLITTPKGHILINTGLAESVPNIQSNVEKLGFRFKDIRILLTNQVHFDHVGGMAQVKKMTGAMMMVDAADASVLADGGFSDFALGGRGKLFLPVKANRLLHDHDTIRLGNTQLVTLHHPGHTKGACSFLLDVKDSARSFRVLIANLPTTISEMKFPSMSTYPGIGKDFAYTLTAMKTLQFDIWLAAHASQFNLLEKHKPGDGYHPEAFMDRAGYDAMLNSLQTQFNKRLAEK